jgi:hypothetical protein
MFWLKTVKLSKKPKKPNLLATMARVGGRRVLGGGGGWSIVAEILGFLGFLDSFTVFNQNIGFYWALQRFCFISLENHKILLLFIRNQEINVHWEAPGKPWEAPGGSGVLSGALGCSGELRRCLGGHGELWGALGIGKLSGALGGSGDLLDIYQSKGLKK